MESVLPGQERGLERDSVGGQERWEGRGGRREVERGEDSSLVEQGCTVDWGGGA